MLLYIIRHGDPDYETDSLTPRGVLQAEAVGKRLLASGIDRIFSSPLGRARQTAEPACKLLGLPCNIEEWAEELVNKVYRPASNGEHESVLSVQNTYYRENGNIDLPYQRAFQCQGIDFSYMKDKIFHVEEHGKTFLEKLGYKEENGIYRILKRNEEKVALFCHAAVSSVWISVLLHIPIHLMWASFSPTHTGVTVIEFKNYENGITAPRCLCFSDTSHLYAEGLDLLHCGEIPL